VDLAELYSRHVARLQTETEPALVQTGFSSLVVSSGAPFTYFADDRDAPFCPTPTFAHWCPLGGPHHLLHVMPGRRPKLVRYAPEDYWYEQGGAADGFWRDAFDFEEAGTIEAAWRAIGRPARAAYIGNETGRGEEAGLAANPEPLVARLDWLRSEKDAYEVRCLEEATATGARAHLAAREAFERGASELEIHHVFLAEAGATEAELPYSTIVALDEKAATLHYERKRTQRGGRVLLLDAGVACRGYACDITRTTLTAGVDERFRALVARLEVLQRELARGARPGRAFLELHVEAHRGVARILCGLGLLRVSAEEAFDKGLTHPFLPHGLGHQLGIQVHDVAGRQSDAQGTPAPPPPEYPFLRNTRTIAPGQVFTIEPGIYFIPMLLRPFRGGGDAGAFDWDAIDALLPCGGVRIEDNVLVTDSGPRNLTRERLPD
jgi:Xaa-Pro dipeptidase